MDLQTDVNGIKCFLQMLKRALHGCMARREPEGRSPLPQPPPTDAPGFRARAASYSPDEGGYDRPARPDEPPNEPEEAATDAGFPGVDGALCDDCYRYRYYSNSDNDDSDDDDACETMTFQEMPYECKLKIFTYLSAAERGMAERVCRDWRDVIRSPTLWTHVDLSLLGSQRKAPGASTPTLASTSFPFPPLHFLPNHPAAPLIPPPTPATTADSCQDSETGQSKTKTCREEAEIEYEAYKTRVNGYVDYLRGVRPCVKSLSFSFDIGDSTDSWAQLVRTFLESARTKNAESADIDWKDTPAKPTALADGSGTWSTGNYSDLMYKQRRRQRLFVSLFDAFTALVPNLRRLSLPFDWSSSSVAYLSRLGSTLVRLRLGEYFVPQPLEQSLLDRLLAGLPNLQELSVGMVLGSGLGMSGYEIRSRSLVSLDLSACQGFAVTRAELPELRRLTISNASFPSQLVVVAPAAAADEPEAEVLQRHEGRRRSFGTTPAPPAPPAPPPPSSSSSSSSSHRVGLKTSQSSPSLCPQPGGQQQKMPVPSCIPCLFNVLKRGAPSLRFLNDYRLPEDWKEAFDPKLEAILHDACPCLYHHQYNRNRQRYNNNNNNNDDNNRIQHRI